MAAFRVCFPRMYNMEGPESPNDRDEFEVERILNKAKLGPQVYYLVKWNGYDEVDSSWEPAGHMLAASKAITDYETENSLAFQPIRAKYFWPKMKLKSLRKTMTVEQVGPENWRIVQSRKKFAREPLRICRHYWSSRNLSLKKTLHFVIEVLSTQYGAPRQSTATLAELEAVNPKMVIDYLVNATHTEK